MKQNKQKRNPKTTYSINGKPVSYKGFQKHLNEISKKLKEY